MKHSSTFPKGQDPFPESPPPSPPSPPPLLPGFRARVPSLEAPVSPPLSLGHSMRRSRSFELPMRSPSSAFSAPTPRNNGGRRLVASPDDAPAEVSRELPPSSTPDRLGGLSRSNSLPTPPTSAPGSYRRTWLPSPPPRAPASLCPYPPPLVSLGTPASLVAAGSPDSLNELAGSSHGVYLASPLERLPPAAGVKIAHARSPSDCSDGSLFELALGASPVPAESPAGVWRKPAAAGAGGEGQGGRDGAQFSFEKSFEGAEKEADARGFRGGSGGEGEGEGGAGEEVEGGGDGGWADMSPRGSTTAADFAECQCSERNAGAETHRFDDDI